MRALLSLCALALAMALVPTAGQAGPALEPPPHDDALIAPPPSAGLASAGDDLRGPSQYMAGEVAVRLVLPESNGGAEPQSENWTPEEIAQVTAQVRGALSWWEARLPMARLAFTLRVDVVPTRYEPIKHGLSDEGLWIGDSLRNLGFNAPGYFDQTYLAGDANRAATDADWTTTIFLVDSSAHPTGTFTDGRFAYAYINGPLMVITSDAGGYGTSRLAPVVAHELGHIFGALDQYAAARIPCERRSGYLNTPTSNSQYGGCGTREPSIMLEPLGAFSAGQVDGSAQAQLGYKDSDGDALIDPLDTAPTLEMLAERLAAGSGRPLLSGTTRDLPFASPFQQRVTLNHIAGVDYRVDGGPWLPVDAEDGAYDESAESFAAELPLYDGTYAVELRARNIAGVASSVAVRRLTVSGLGAQPEYSATLPAVVGSPQLSLSLSAPAGAEAVEVSESAAFAGVEWQPYTPQLSYALMAGDGAHTIYVRFRDAAGLASLPIAVPVTLDTCPPAGSAARNPGDPTELIIEAHDDTTGVAAVELQVGSQAPVWQSYTARVELGAGSEGAAVTLRFRDGAGNVSAPYNAPTGYKVALPFVVR